MKIFIRAYCFRPKELNWSWDSCKVFIFIWISLLKLTPLDPTSLIEVRDSWNSFDFYMKLFVKAYCFRPNELNWSWDSCKVLIFIYFLIKSLSWLFQVRTWRSRGSIPGPVDVTCTLLEIQLKDGFIELVVSMIFLWSFS